MESLQDRLADWNGEIVIIDCVSPYVAIGTLKSAGVDHLELIDADMHDLRDTVTSRELYIVKAARHGVQPNRATLLLRLAEIVGVSRLDDVITG